MSKKVSIEYFRSKGLLPFQVEFAAKFLQSEEKRYWQLVSPVGAGKTRLAGAIIAHELEIRGEKRFLVLCPALLLNQWQSEISNMVSSKAEGSTPIIVDRKTYLEFESRVPVGQSPWPSVAIILMSIDLAKKENMVRNLTGIVWDLIIIDESHLLIGKRKGLFKHLVDSEVMSHCLLLTATPSHKFEGVVTKVVNRREIFDWNGQAIYPSFKKVLTTLEFERPKEEKDFLTAVEKFAYEFAILKTYGKFQSLILLRIACSSMYALEGSLRRLLASWRSLRNKIAHSIPWTNEDLETAQQELAGGIDEVEALEEIPEGITVQPEKFLNLYQKLEGLINRLEEIRTDSKLNCLLSYVKKSIQDDGKEYLCIWTSFRNTVEYLYSCIQELDIPVYILTGSLNVNERANNLNLFRQNGGILISTDALLEGVSLEFVDESINYDLPIDPTKLEQRWGRFLRIGRKREFRMVFMRDKSKSLIWEEKLFETLENAIKA